MAASIVRQAAEQGIMADTNAAAAVGGLGSQDSMPPLASQGLWLLIPVRGHVPMLIQKPYRDDNITNINDQLHLGDAKTVRALLCYPVLGCLQDCTIEGNLVVGLCVILHSINLIELVQHAQRCTTDGQSDCTQILNV